MVLLLLLFCFGFFFGWFFSMVPTGWRGRFLVEANEIVTVSPPIECQISGATLGSCSFAGII